MASGKPNVHSQLNLKDLNNAMRREAAGVATRWYELGVELLDSNTAVLDVIQSDHQSDNARCSKMFKAWLEMKPDASWSQLVTALNNIGLNTAADNLRQSKMSNKVTDLVQIPTIIRQSDPGDTNTISTAEQASVEFGVLLDEILEELMKNENKNLKLLKRTSSTLTLKDKPGIKIFSDSELETIYACNDIETLLIIKLRHCYRWDDHSMLNVLMSKLNAEECLRLLRLFETKVCGKMKLQQLHEHSLQGSVNIPEGYHKMIAIVNKIFSDITKEEYDELKQFISQHCGVEPYVVSPFFKVSPFNSMVIEWFIPVNAVSYMIETAKNNVHMFTKEIFLYLKISSTVIFDHRNNESECVQLLTAAEAGDVVTVKRLIHARYIDVNTTSLGGKTALHYAAWSGQVQAIETLIRFGADVNALDKFGKTALHYAVGWGQVQAIETLIRFGADVNALDESTQSWIKKMLERNWSSGHGSDLSTWEEKQMKYKITMPSSKQPQTQSHTSTEKSPSPSSFTAKQSSKFSDHKSTTDESRVSSHGLEVKQKEQEQFIKSSDDDGGKVVDTNTRVQEDVL